jgi:hypothetical protein
MTVFQLSPRVYLERFDTDSLLLVADRDRLLTINGAAADLFEEAIGDLGGASFTLEEGADWLAGHYEMSVRQCRLKARELLAFGLKHGLVSRIGRSGDD